MIRSVSASMPNQQKCVSRSSSNHIHDALVRESGQTRVPVDPVAKEARPTSVSEQPIPNDGDSSDVLRKPRREVEMDMTPMVDVTFLLLIFFMVTASFSLQKSIEMPRQQTDDPSGSANPEPPEDFAMIEIQVDRFGSFLVMAPNWERETPGKQNLVGALKEAIEGNTMAMRLVIRVHEMARLQALVDAMDAGAIAGFSQLELTQVAAFD